VFFALLLDIPDLTRDVLQRGFVVLVRGLQLCAKQNVSNTLRFNSILKGFYVRCCLSSWAFDAMV
jgi:hypothetical protein